MRHAIDPDGGLSCGHGRLSLGGDRFGEHGGHEDDRSARLPRGGRARATAITRVGARRKAPPPATRRRFPPQRPPPSGFPARAAEPPSGGRAKAASGPLIGYEVDTRPQVGKRGKTRGGMIMRFSGTARVGFILGMLPPDGPRWPVARRAEKLVRKQSKRWPSCGGRWRRNAMRLPGSKVVLVGRTSNPAAWSKATEPKPPPTAAGELRATGSKTSRLLIHEERTVNVAAPPRGSRFKGYTSFVVQDLVIRPHVVNFRCERWQTPDGGTMTAPLPAGISGHFGPQLRRFVLAQYHQGQVTVARLVDAGAGFGIFISKRQARASADRRPGRFLAEARDVLRAGLSSAAWITVDDTGARHKATNGFCTQMGNAYFAWFGTTDSRAAAISSNYCAPATTIMSSMPRRWPICDNARCRAGDRPPARTSRAFLHQPGRLDRTSRTPRHLGSRGQSRSGHGRHRGRLVGQRQGARLPARHRHRQR